MCIFTVRILERLKLAFAFIVIVTLNSTTELEAEVDGSSNFTLAQIGMHVAGITYY